MKRLKCLFSVVVYLSTLHILFAIDNKINNTNNYIFTELKEIFSNPAKYLNKLVTVRGKFLGWRGKVGYPPPVTRSDWILQSMDNYYSIYCTGIIKNDLRPDDPTAYEKEIIVLGKVLLDKYGNPYIQVTDVNFPQPIVEKMVSVSQLLFDPLSHMDKLVGLLGVLTKGVGMKGERIYLLADPTGAITLERLPKLYPKGTILRIRGIMTINKDGLPVIKDVEILSAQP